MLPPPQLKVAPAVVEVAVKVTVSYGAGQSSRRVNARIRRRNVF